MLSNSTDDDAHDKLVQEKLVSFCKLLDSNYRQIKQLIGPERANVDKTLVKASRYELLEKSGISTTSKVYTEDQIEKILTECLNEINERLIATGRLVSTLDDDYEKLLQSYRELDEASRTLNWSRTDSPLISGTSTQKGLEYYLQEGYLAVQQLNLVVIQVKFTFNAVDMLDKASIERFRDCLKMSEELDAYLQEFVAYTVFIVK
ncbi:uncharacterized protein LOC131426099 [Malaya genurostris]|uniref:uncharacterized protein LOC131426099 n=1 Tax=Malaya genurostris TaxID=325434 RepID=UPI0026F39AB8|nr:uncharacterized protein LOC131426099 [Malaya genurostris]